MSLFSLPFRASSNPKKRRATRSSSPSRSVISRVRLSVECLEDRTLLTASWLGDLAGPDGLQALIAPAIDRDGNAAVVWDGGVQHAVAGQWVAGFTGVAGTADEQVRSIQQELTRNLPADLNVAVVRQLGLDGQVLIQVSTDVPEYRLKCLADITNVLYVEPNVTGQVLSVIPNDSDFAKLYGMRNTGQVINGQTGIAGADVSATSAWDVTTGSYQIVIADIDTGIDYTHPDLRDNVWLNNAEIPASRLQNLKRYVSNPGNPDDTTKPITFADLNDARNWGSFKITPHNDGTGHMVVDANDVLANMDRDGSGNDLGTGGWAFPNNTLDGDTEHPNDYVGWNFVANNNRPLDDNSHGSHTAGTIGAEGNNGIGVAGVNWVTQIMGLKWIAGSGSGSDADAIAAVNYSVLHGAKVSNNSWHIFDFNVGLYNAVRNARDHGDLFVAAAQNSAINNDTGGDFPAIFTRTTSAGPALDNVIAVAATDNRDGLASFSNYGLHTVQLGAPGVDVWSTFPVNQGSYSFDSGTSMASPHVAGAATLLWGYSPHSTYLEIKNAIMDGVDPITSLNGRTITGGRLNVFKSLQLVVPPAGPSVTNQTPASDTFGQISSIRLTFDRSIDVGTFTADKIDSFTDPNGNAIAVVAITPVAGTSDTRFDISFATQSTLGNYTMVLGPDIEDTLGNPMDQDRDGIAGEPTDVYTARFNLDGPKITASTIIQGATFQPGALTSVQLTFNEPIDPATFNNPSQVLFINPSGAIYFASSVTPVAGSNNTRFNLGFAANVTGRYTLIVLPTMRDAFGMQLDQNGNFVPGEIPADEYIQHFNISGPKVTASQNLTLGDPANQIFNRVQVTFDEAMDPSSFTPAQVHFTSPTGAPVPVNAVVPMAGSGNKQFNILFDPQGQIGVYSVAVGPNVRDTFGNPMDQNGNLIPGEDPADRYTTGFTVHGPAARTDFTFEPDNYADNQILNHAFPGVTLSYLGNSTNSVVAYPTPPGSAGGARLFGSTDPTYGPEFFSGGGYELRIDFATPVSSVTIDAIGFTGQAKGLLRIFNASGELANVTTPAVLARGELATLSLSRPDITYALASSDNFDTGLVLDNLRFRVGARTSQAPVNSYRVTFDKPIDVSSFTPDKVASFTDPHGNPVAVDGVFPVPGSNFTQFDVTFRAQVLAGTYTLVIGPDVRDLWGNAMDENGNLIAGEVPDDQFTGTFQISGLQVTGSTSGVQSPPVDHVHLTFNEPVDPASFTAEQVASFTGPDGGDIAITGVSAVPFTNNTQFDIFFDPQSALGNYTMVLGGGIHDLYGNALENADPVRFSIQTIIVFDPDDYASGQVLNHAFPGVTLSFLGNSTNSVVALPTPPGSAGGARVFGSTTGGSFSPEFYNDPGSGTSTWWLRINFVTPVSSVSIDAIGTARYSGQAKGLLRIYDAANHLLGTAMTANVLAGGQLATLSLSRPTADIAYAFASSDQANQGVLLDNLRFTTSSGPFAVPGAGRSYSIPGLTPGEPLTREVIQPGWTQTVSAEGSIDLANVQNTEPGAFRAPPSSELALAVSASMRIRDPFEDPIDSNDWWWI